MRLRWCSDYVELMEEVFSEDRILGRTLEVIKSFLLEQLVNQNGITGLALGATLFASLFKSLFKALFKALFETLFETLFASLFKALPDSSSHLYAIMMLQCHESHGIPPPYRVSIHARNSAVEFSNEGILADTAVKDVF